MTFFTGLIIVNRMRQALVMDHKIVALHYTLHGPFLLDLAVTASLWAEVTCCTPAEKRPVVCCCLSEMCWTGGAAVVTCT